ncbi:MAG: hypothetical protein IJY58_05925, partial [Alphaproteobacteria bacterium]|nr:hypothetical protein [Alphaproteobacteria bacterium]
RSQCLACGNREWYGGFCQKRLNCASDEFYRNNGSTQFECSKCSDNRNKILDMWATWTSMGDLTYTCDNCPSTAPRYSVHNGSYCLPVCEQPPEGSEGDTICKTDPRSPLCQRKWQNSNGNCLACNVETTKNQLLIHGTTPQEMHDLCTACGRKVIGDKCVLEKNKTDCKTGQFLGKDGICYDCNGKDGVAIASDEISGCTARCSKNENGEYDENGTIKTREVFVSQQWGTLCRPVCPDNTLYFLNQHTTGYCLSCTDKITNGYFAIDANSYSDCEDRCPNRVLYSGHGTYCSPKKCPDNYYKTRWGTCVPCSRSNSGDDDVQTGEDGSTDGVALCNACGNRMVYNRGTQWSGDVCFVIDPGKSGVCNSRWSHEFPSDMSDDIIKKAQPYLDGKHDGEKFLSTDGYCYDCSTPTTHTTIQAECEMCNNRRWTESSGYYGPCSKGLCDSGFFLSGSSCLACSNVNKPIDPSKENLCSSCDNRRQMEIGTPETTWTGLCVKECAGSQWQDINGNCLLCSEGGDRQIGTDAESRRLCNDCDGLRESQPIYGGTEGAEVIGYKCVLK